MTDFKYVPGPPSVVEVPRTGEAKPEQQLWVEHDRQCLASDPHNRHCCTVEKGHPGAHVACDPMFGNAGVLAAWPGRDSEAAPTRDVVHDVAQVQHDDPERQNPWRNALASAEDQPQNFYDHYREVVARSRRHEAIPGPCMAMLHGIPGQVWTCALRHGHSGGHEAAKGWPSWNDEASAPRRESPKPSLPGGDEHAFDREEYEESAPSVSKDADSQEKTR